MEKLTANEYHQLSRGQIQEREDSFDRCDTDGFLSQWASGVHSNLYLRLAELAEAGWVSEFPGLFDIKTGERVPAKIIYVKDRFSYNGALKALWAIVDPKTEKFTGVFLPEGENSRKQKKLGFFQKKEIAPAYAKIDGVGYGLSGSVWVSVYRTDCGYPKELRQVMTREEVVDTIIQNKTDNLEMISTSNKVSSNGKNYIQISFKNGNCGISLDVYGPKFILGKSQNDRFARPTFNSIDDALEYINRTREQSRPITKNIMPTTEQGIDNLEILMDFIQQALSTEINFFPLGEDNVEFPVDACVFLCEDSHVIDIYVDDISSNIDTVISCLIHEMGHILCYEQVGNNHTEQDAWDAAVLSLPKELIPETFEDIKEYSLSEYELEEDDKQHLNVFNMLFNFMSHK